MTIVEIATFVPQKTGPNEGDVQLVQQQLQIVLESVFFAVKQPLTPNLEFCMQLPGSLATPTPIPDEQWEEAGFTKFDSVEGGFVWMKPDNVQFYFSPELGVYVFVYPGGRVGIKTTTNDVKAFFEGSKGGSIVL
jgi:hypothetical protein